MKWGQYILTLVALAAVGCASGSLVGSLPVVPDPAHAATVVVMRQYNFEGSGVAPTITIDGLATYELGVSEHGAIPVAPGERLVGLLLRRSLSNDERASVKIRAEAGRTYYVLMALVPGRMAEITESEAREIMATTKALGGQR
jgi:hypothetical protein